MHNFSKKKFSSAPGEVETSPDRRVPGPWAKWGRISPFSVIYQLEFFLYLHVFWSFSYFLCIRSYYIVVSFEDKQGICASQ